MHLQEVLRAHWVLLHGVSAKKESVDVRKLLPIWRTGASLGEDPLIRSSMSDLAEDMSLLLLTGLWCPVKYLLVVRNGTNSSV